MFQSTRPRGARRLHSGLKITDLSFNPRARGGRDSATMTALANFKGFNPRARGGRDLVGF